MVSYKLKLHVQQRLATLVIISARPNTCAMIFNENLVSLNFYNKALYCAPSNFFVFTFCGLRTQEFYLLFASELRNSCIDIAWVRSLMLRTYFSLGISLGKDRTREKAQIQH